MPGRARPVPGRWSATPPTRPSPTTDRGRPRPPASRRSAARVGGSPLSARRSPGRDDRSPVGPSPAGYGRAHSSGRGSAKTGDRSPSPSLLRSTWHARRQSGLRGPGQCTCTVISFQVQPGKVATAPPLPGRRFPLDGGEGTSRASPRRRPKDAPTGAARGVLPPARHPDTCSLRYRSPTIRRMYARCSSSCA